MESKFDKNVPKNWKPVAGLENRKPGMSFSDRLWHWLVSLGGLVLIGVGIAWMVYIPYPRRAGIFIAALGIGVFFTGFPSQAQRNGYRE
jgi:hypothetical protein